MNNLEAAKELDQVAQICSSTKLSEAASMGAAVLRNDPKMYMVSPTPVEQGPPPKNECVLVFVTKGQYKRIRFLRTWLFGEWDEDEGWMLSDYPEAEDFTITHWAPLPGDPGRVEA